MTTYTPLFSAEKIDHKIAELQKKTYLPEEMVKLVAQVIRLLLEAESNVRFTDDAYPAMPAAIIQALPVAATHAQGVALLPREQFPIDTKVAATLTDHLFTAITKCTPELAVHVQELAANFRSNPCSLEEACKAVVAEGGVSASTSKSYFADWEKMHPDAPNFFRFIAQTAVMPSAIVVARLLAPYHNNEHVWHHGHCPVCGSLPLMGHFKNKEGIRMHACSFCSFEYRVPRIGCPFCLKSSPDDSQYFSSDDEPGYQIHVCNSCKNYIKVADFRAFDKNCIPMLDDLESLILDLHARQMGYTRPTSSAWGF